MMHACQLRYDGHVIRVEADAQSHLSWLIDSLHPPFALADTEEQSARRIRLVHDRTRHSELVAAGPAPGGHHSCCFLLDSRVVKHPHWIGPDGKRTMYDIEYRAFYIVDDSGVEIIADGSNYWSRVALFRVVRELAVASNRGQTLSLHAAAAIVDSRGVLLAGQKRAGKTSLLCHLLGHEDASLVANDRATVRDMDKPASFVGVPTIVKVREGTVQLFQDRLGRVDRHGDLACRRDGEPPGDDELAEGLLMNPAQFSDLVGSDRAAGSTLDAIVFPRVTEDPEISLSRLSPEAAVAHLEASLYGSREDDDQVSALTPGAEASPGNYLERCANLARSVPCFECHMGPGAYAADPGARRFVEGLFT
jgi:hypothetical protein